MALPTTFALVPDYQRRTRESYDRTAADYAVWITAELATKPVDRAVLDLFAEVTSGPVADLGCGAGRMGGYLRDRGLDVVGVDLSPGMVAAARRTQPDLPFAVGSLTALPIVGGVFGGLLAWYSIIHVPDDDLPRVFAEFRRVLAPGGHVQLAFQTGAGREHRTRAGGHAVALDFHRREPEEVVAALARAGLATHTTTVRAPDTDGDFTEDTPQAYVLARRT